MTKQTLEHAASATSPACYENRECEYELGGGYVVPGTPLVVSTSSGMRIDLGGIGLVTDSVGSPFLFISEQLLDSLDRTLNGAPALVIWARRSSDTWATKTAIKVLATLAGSTGLPSVTVTSINSVCRPMRVPRFVRDSAYPEGGVGQMLLTHQRLAEQAEPSAGTAHLRPVGEYGGDSIHYTGYRGAHRPAPVGWPDVRPEAAAEHRPGRRQGLGAATAP
jgi:hypothetical protein